MSGSLVFFAEDEKSTVTKLKDEITVGNMCWKTTVSPNGDLRLHRETKSTNRREKINAIFEERYREIRLREQEFNTLNILIQEYINSEEGEAFLNDDIVFHIEAMKNHRSEIEKLETLPLVVSSKTTTIIDEVVLFNGQRVSAPSALCLDGDVMWVAHPREEPSQDLSNRTETVTERKETVRLGWELQHTFGEFEDRSALKLFAYRDHLFDLCRDAVHVFGPEDHPKYDELLIFCQIVLQMILMILIILF